jgi:Ca2+-binding EF-hand superfamily protein
VQREQYKHEITNWWNKYSVGGYLLYREVITHLYGKKIKQKKKQRTSEQEKVIHELRVKLFQYLAREDHTLDELFAIMDKDKNKEIDVGEFKHGLRNAMTSGEAEQLFKAIDIDGNGDLTRDEIAIELSTINCAQMMQ